MADFTVYELPGSPNSIKVALALAWKRVPFQVLNGDTPDRAPIVALSGQPLLPILVHGQRVVYDSCAIVRYLDVELRFPPLFDTDRGRMGQIEVWELFARTKLAEMMRLVVGQYFAQPALDYKKLGQANAILSEAAGDIEPALAASGGQYLMGPNLNAADLTVGAFMSYGTLEEAQESQPVRLFFARQLRLPPAFPRTRAWIARVMALLPAPAAPAPVPVAAG